MAPQTANFDRVAKPYRWLEYLAFGAALMRTRSALLNELTGARRVLILGEGDGRFLAQLLQVNPQCRVECVEQSREMVRLARKEVAKLGADARVTFHCRDALTLSYPAHAYDLIVTLFFLDVLTDAQLKRLVCALAESLRPGGHWYTADFRVPQEPLKRLHSLVWLQLLYRFFGWQTGMPARSLVEPAPFFAKNGLTPLRTHYRRWDMLYSQLLQKAAPQRH